MTTIKILEKQTYQEYQTEIDQGRYANIIISNETDHYSLSVGGLPLEGDLQLILETREEELWQVAQTINVSLTIEEIRVKLYNSPLAGGWTQDEFQEAFNEHFGGKAAKLQRIRTLRNAIRAVWPYEEE